MRARDAQMFQVRNDAGLKFLFESVTGFSSARFAGWGIFDLALHCVRKKLWAGDL
jgi:hypothetical protein